MIASELNDDAEYIASIVLGKKLLLYDANNKLKAYAYNFQVNDVKGYVVLGAHSKTFLIDGVYLDAQLSENMDRIYYFSNEEIYYQEQKKYYTSNYDTITEQEFQGYRGYKVGCYTNVSIELLESIQSQNQAIVYQSLHKFSELQVGNTHYKGTDSNAYGYGGIRYPKIYLKDRYGSNVSQIGENVVLPVNVYKMEKVSQKVENNCSLVAISKILKYWQKHRGMKNIPSNIQSIFKDVEQIGKKYGYDKTTGLNPTKINNIVLDVLKKYGYKNSKCNGVYIWTFSGQVKKEIDNNRPVIMNIARGYYGNHSVVVMGYGIYKVNNSTKEMIIISDGWEYGKRYIDYQAFAYDLATSGFGSFNTIIVN